MGDGCRRVNHARLRFVRAWRPNAIRNVIQGRGKLSSDGWSAACAIDAGRKRVMALDQVRVVTVHRANEIADRGPHHGVQAPGQGAGLRDPVGRQILEFLPILGQEWLHGRHVHFAAFLVGG